MMYVTRIPYGLNCTLQRAVARELYTIIFVPNIIIQSGRTKTKFKFRQEPKQLNSLVPLYNISHEPQFKFILKFSASSLIEHSNMISVFKHLVDGVLRVTKSYTRNCSTFSNNKHFFSTTLGTNKHAINRFLYPFVYLAQGSFLSAGGNALPYMQIADASYPSVNPSENT